MRFSLLPLALLPMFFGIACDGDDGKVDDSEPTNNNDDSDVVSDDADGDGVDAAEDCDDNDPNASMAGEAWTDGDGDGFGSGEAAAWCGEAPAGSVDNGDDCDDADGAVNPGAAEDCAEADQDCDGEPYLGAPDAVMYYPDADGDGAGDMDGAVASCEPLEGYLETGTDCDDGDAMVNDQATELCDTVDNNCDGETDEAGADGELTWYPDADGDGYGDADSDEASTQMACTQPSGYVETADDCDDADAAVSPDATEADDAMDNDCDGATDEDFRVAGDLVISEVVRQPTLGGGSVNTDGYWFELYNPTSEDIDLSGWYIQRSGAIDGVETTDGFYVDPVNAVVVPAGGYAVLCKTDLYAFSATAAMPLNCDYVWGDPDQDYSYSSTYHDNTFNLQRDEDTLSLWANGDATSGTMIEELHWTYDGTDGYWPRDARYSMSLDPGSLDAASNDMLDNWCSTTVNELGMVSEDQDYRWYDTSGTDEDEYGTPGMANYACPAVGIIP